MRGNPLCRRSGSPDSPTKLVHYSPYGLLAQPLDLIPMIPSYGYMGELPDFAPVTLSYNHTSPPPSITSTSPLYSPESPPLNPTSDLDSPDSPPSSPATIDHPAAKPVARQTELQKRMQKYLIDLRAWIYYMPHYGRTPCRQLAHFCTFANQVSRQDGF